MADARRVAQGSAPHVGATEKQAGEVEGSEEYWYELVWFIENAEAHYDATGTLTHVTHTSDSAARQ
jgi:hypothetical protein